MSQLKGPCSCVHKHKSMFTFFIKLVKLNDSMYMYIEVFRTSRRKWRTRRNCFPFGTIIDVLNLLFHYVLSTSDESQCLTNSKQTQLLKISVHHNQE